MNELRNVFIRLCVRKSWGVTGFVLWLCEDELKKYFWTVTWINNYCFYDSYFGSYWSRVLIVLLSWKKTGFGKRSNYLKIRDVSCIDTLSSNRVAILLCVRVSEQPKCAPFGVWVGRLPTSRNSPRIRRANATTGRGYWRYQETSLDLDFGDAVDPGLIGKMIRNLKLTYSFVCVLFCRYTVLYYFVINRIYGLFWHSEAEIATITHHWRRYFGHCFSEKDEFSSVPDCRTRLSSCSRRGSSTSESTFVSVRTCQSNNGWSALLSIEWCRKAAGAGDQMCVITTGLAVLSLR